MKVFISGSISLKTFYTTPVEELVERNRTILIGDACGIDKAVQQYLYEQKYQNVIVYFSGDKVRNNIGYWQTKQIPNPDNLTGKSRYQLKDKAMADDCDSAIMFWDGKSKGTKHNRDYVEKLDKYFLVWIYDPSFLVWTDIPFSLICGNMHKINNMVML